MLLHQLQKFRTETELMSLYNTTQRLFENEHTTTAVVAALGLTVSLGFVLNVHV